LRSAYLRITYGTEAYRRYCEDIMVQAAETVGLPSSRCSAWMGAEALVNGAKVGKHLAEHAGLCDLDASSRGPSSPLPFGQADLSCEMGSGEQPEG
jgi:hypothetical protein